MFLRVWTFEDAFSANPVSILACAFPIVRRLTSHLHRANKTLIRSFLISTCNEFSFSFISSTWNFFLVCCIKWSSKIRTSSDARDEIRTRLQNELGQKFCKLLTWFFIKYLLHASLTGKSKSILIDFLLIIFLYTILLLILLFIWSTWL